MLVFNLLQRCQSRAHFIHSMNHSHLLINAYVKLEGKASEPITGTRVDKHC